MLGVAAESKYLLGVAPGLPHAVGVLLVRLADIGYIDQVRRGAEVGRLFLVEVAAPLASRAPDEPFGAHLRCVLGEWLQTAGDGGRDLDPVPDVMARRDRRVALGVPVAVDSLIHWPHLLTPRATRREVHPRPSLDVPSGIPRWPFFELLRPDDNVEYESREGETCGVNIPLSGAFPRLYPRASIYPRFLPVVADRPVTVGLAFIKEIARREHDELR